MIRRFAAACPDILDCLPFGIVVELYENPLGTGFPPGIILSSPHQCEVRIN
jgi:hypothetical protein